MGKAKVISKALIRSRNLVKRPKLPARPLEKKTLRTGVKIALVGGAIAGTTGYAIHKKRKKKGR